MEGWLSERFPCQPSRRFIQMNNVIILTFPPLNVVDYSAATAAHSKGLNIIK